MWLLFMHQSLLNWWWNIFIVLRWFMNGPFNLFSFLWNRAPKAINAFQLSKRNVISNSYCRINFYAHLHDTINIVTCFRCSNFLNAFHLEKKRQEKKNFFILSGCKMFYGKVWTEMQRDIIDFQTKYESEVWTSWK